MKVKVNQILNLMDTNGRRNDVINALQGYLSILDEIKNTKNMIWGSIPNSLAQYEFYKQAIELSPDVFKKHEPYDELQEELEKHKIFKVAINNNDINWIQENHTQYNTLIKKFDLGAEDRARHYTNTLVKLGFTDETRRISPVGKLLLDTTKLKKDALEKTLPIDDVNIIYLRQLLKLRVFDTKGTKFYSPFNFAIYALLKTDRLSENKFLELVQGLNPYYNFKCLDNFISTYQEGDIVNNIKIKFPPVINNQSKIRKDDFKDYFKNQKSTENVDLYWTFYDLLYSFKEQKDVDTLDALLSFYEENREMINKAFGCGKNLFSYRISTRPSPVDFIESHKKVFKDNLNVYLYSIFTLSKKLDQIREYSDTTKRIFKASGIISFDNGYVELAYKELCKCIFKENVIKERVFGDISNELHPHYECYGDYEGQIESYFYSITSLSDILKYSNEVTQAVIEDIQSEFDGADVSQIPNIVASKRKQEFAEYIDKVFPKKRVKKILELFSDRKNDKAIKDEVSSIATIPTIYEYMIGIAWYYFSGKRIDLLESYNLTLSANFEPLVHAGGGKGDIVIYEEDKVIMLEATLMNANSQKRGEWEPVLRHSVNLKIEEETNKTGREVTSFFIADEFDCNTINIWKAVAAVPMQSSVDKNKFTDNVIIMPISTSELCNLMDKSEQYDDIIKMVHKLFEMEKSNFDLEWRNKFIKKIV